MNALNGALLWCNALIISIRLNGALLWCNYLYPTIHTSSHIHSSKLINGCINYMYNTHIHYNLDFKHPYNTYAQIHGNKLLYIFNYV